MPYTVRLEQAASRPLAVVRRKAPMQQLSKVVPEACGTVWNVMRAQQVAGAGRHVALYFDCEVNLEVGVELEQPFGGFGDVVDSSTPAGLVATTTHFEPCCWATHTTRFGNGARATATRRQACSGRSMGMAG